MAKKVKLKLIPESKVQDTSKAIEARNLQRIEYYISLSNQIYDDLIIELAKIAISYPGGLKAFSGFSFDKIPGIKAKVNKLLNDTTIRAVNSLTGGIDDAFLRANAKNDALVDAVFQGTGISKKKLARYYNRNLEGAVTRATKSELSENVYNITKQFKIITEGAIDSGIASGKTAVQLAADIRKAVKDPTPLFRRVKVVDSKGKSTLKLSKSAIKYREENPAVPGKYYSPVKNYQRLTRTEINMAYRTADHNRVQSMDFVVGIRINLSNNPNHCPFCIAMAGDYPKTFLFRGWHPQCRCYKTTILKTRQELDRDNKLILQDKKPSIKSVNTVKQPPSKFTDYLESDAVKRMKERDSLPYWYQDNINDKGKVVAGKVIGGVAK